MVRVSMQEHSVYAHRPLAFSIRFIALRPVWHAFIVAAVLGAVICSVSTQYGIKLLVDALSSAERNTEAVWTAFGILAALIAADNLLWRVAGWAASSTFVAVSGDLRRDLFQHVTGHAPSFFTNQSPAALTSRITATSNALFVTENMFIWNVLPPCVASIGALVYIGMVNLQMAMLLATVGGGVVAALFKLAAAGKPLHQEFASKAAAVDGEMVDVVGNIALVKAFGGLARERRRFEKTIDQEMAARRASLFYLERIRSLHAFTTIALIFALLVWAVTLWQRRLATTGDVILICTLGMSVLHATRDLAVALVDVTQHIARLSEALETLLVGHELRDAPTAKPLLRQGASIAFENVSFAYPRGGPVFSNLDLHIGAGERVALVGRSGGGKSTVFALLQRFYDVQKGRILIDGQDIIDVTQHSLREAIAIVPQDVSLFHRSILENIRYGRPDATDGEVRAAAFAARCGDFIEELPNGFDTLAGDRGFRLSGGQRQRIAMARAFLKDAPLLLLDEATSALDVESEEGIREALGRLMRGRTVIAIAHRLSTVRSFDRILVLDQGKIVQDGSPEQLSKCDGLYRMLVQVEMNRLNQTLVTAS
jgi:ATP-binding cassette, subfamily B, bacterial